MNDIIQEFYFATVLFLIVIVVLVGLVSTVTQKRINYSNETPAGWEKLECPLKDCLISQENEGN